MKDPVQYSHIHIYGYARKYISMRETNGGYKYHIFSYSYYDLNADIDRCSMATGPTIKFRVSFQKENRHTALNTEIVSLIIDFSRFSPANI